MVWGLSEITGTKGLGHSKEATAFSVQHDCLRKGFMEKAFDNNNNEGGGWIKQYETDFCSMWLWYTVRIKSPGSGFNLQSFQNMFDSQTLKLAELHAEPTPRNTFLEKLVQWKTSNRPDFESLLCYMSNKTFLLS